MGAVPMGLRMNCWFRQPHAEALSITHIFSSHDDAQLNIDKTG
jgi:hypothetical protein